MNRPRALVIGGSLSGLFAANLLRTIGWDVAVFERSSSNLAGRGAGLGTQSALFSVMRRIGIRLDDSIRIEARSRICLDRSGIRVHELPVRDVSTAWDRVYRALSRMLPPEHYHAGMTLDCFEQDAHGVRARFIDGSLARGELLLAADGIHSTVRRQLMPDINPDYAGYVAWRGVVEESSIPLPLRDLALHHMVFCFPDGEMAFSVPMAPPDETDGWNRRCMFVWFRPADYEMTLPQLCTDAEGRSHGTSIPPPLIRLDLLSQLKSAATTLLAPQLATLAAGAKQPILQPIYDLESPRIVFGRVVLLGDAAFVARPHVGTGVTKAALDAQALADALAAASGGIGAALARYDCERRRFGSRLVARGRYLGAHLGGHGRGQAQPHQPIETFLREYGAAGVINGEPISPGHA